MKPIYFKLTKILKESPETFEKSKILGSPVFPKDFIERNDLEDKYFVMQLNLSELNIYNSNTILPSQGFLYFFLDVNTYPYKPSVIYTSEEVIEVYDDINDIYEDFGDYHGYMIEFDDNPECGHYLLGDINQDLDLDCEFDTTGYVTLLEIDSLNLPENCMQIGQPDGWYIFLIKEKDLRNLNFKKVKFVDFGS